MNGPSGPDRHDDGRGDWGGPPGRSDPPGDAGGPADRPRIPPPRRAAEDSGHWPGTPPGDESPADTTQNDGTQDDGTQDDETRHADDVRDEGVRNEAARNETADDRDPPHDQAPPPPAAPVAVPTPSHNVLRSLLGAWALAACSVEETAAVESHLNHCTPCAEEALRLREAVGLLHSEQNLDLDPLLRSRVLEGCLGRRPARIPVPSWAGAYDAEAARLDALLRDMGQSEWRAPVRLKWFDGRHFVERDTTVAGVIGHLMAVDGLVATAVGLPDPLGPAAPRTPEDRTENYWHTQPPEPTSRVGPPGAVREPWREQGHSLVRTVSFAGRGISELPVPYGAFDLALRDAFLDRAFECWVHAGDIAEAVDYPYEPPSSSHLKPMIDLCARLLPSALAERRRSGLAGPPRHLAVAGRPGRTLHLEVEGSGGGHWYIALDSPAAVASPDEEVAHIALDREAFYQLAAGHVRPQEAAAGQLGDAEAIRDVLYATASLSRL